MSGCATPARLRAAMTRATACELAASAAFAVWAWLTVPNANEARSGVTFADPVPSTVMPPAVSSPGALLAPDGWKTPAKAATARAAAVSRAMRASFMRLSLGLSAT